jgi:hypothetical protein
MSAAALLSGVGSHLIERLIGFPDTGVLNKNAIRGGDALSGFRYQVSHACAPLPFARRQYPLGNRKRRAAGRPLHVCQRRLPGLLSSAGAGP